MKRIAQAVQKYLRGIIVLLWIGGLLFLAWLLWRNWDEILPYLSDANIAVLSASFFFFLISTVAASQGWALLMRPVSRNISWKTHTMIYASTIAARRLPGSLWYVGGRLVLYHNLGVPRALVAFASGLEIALIVVSGFLIGFVFLPGFSNLNVWLILLLTLSGAVVFTAPRWINSLLRKRDIEIDKPLNYSDIMGWLTAYAATWTAGGVLVFSVIRSLVPLESQHFPYILGAWAFSGSIGMLTIFLPSTFGLGEISLSILLSSIMPAPLAAVVAILTRLLTFLYDFIVAGMVYLLLNKSMNFPPPSKDRDPSASEET